ncbi:snakin-2-like [Syzygium oleosum]|uniref:snakin-2-like n=1 Tax=Syzygium oleosum TaxID=219896 RepID=UPI0011D290E3|nr:snakin-2-like [Syzygium oleosum]
MALLRVWTTLLLFSLLLTHQAESDYRVIQLNTADTPAPSPPHIDCGGACVARCQLSSRPCLCKRACGTCCVRCDCMPPGTSDDNDACPCYANVTTHAWRQA